MERNVRYIAFLPLLLPLLMAADLKLSWNPNTKGALAGYNVSYDGPASDRWETPCGPYEYSSMGLPMEWTTLGLIHTTTMIITDAAPGDFPHGHVPHPLSRCLHGRVVQAANEHIQNTADTLGERIVGYCANINGTLRWMFYSGDTAWVEETPP